MMLASLGVVALSSCGGVTQINEYNDALKKNFVTSCMNDVRIENKSLRTTELAPESACNCAYRLIKDVYKLSIDDLKAYEQKVADASTGVIPDPPDALNKALADVQQAFGGAQVQGPTATPSPCAAELNPPVDTTTSEAPK